MVTTFLMIIGCLLSYYCLNGMRACAWLEARSVVTGYARGYFAHSVKEEGPTVCRKNVAPQWPRKRRGGSPRGGWVNRDGD